MCGRLRRYGGEDEIGMEMHSPLHIAANIRRIYADDIDDSEVSPGGSGYVFVQDGEGVNIQRSMKWGIIRPWSKPEMPKPSCARSESVTTKPMFKDLITSKRCLIVANGYYEWQKTEDMSTQYEIRTASQDGLLIAGIYDAWRSDDGELIESYAMLTTAPAAAIEHIHHRMPVILEPDCYEPWLDRGLRDLDTITPLLRPYNGDLEYRIVKATPIRKRRTKAPATIKSEQLTLL